MKRLRARMLMIAALTLLLIITLLAINRLGWLDGLDYALFDYQIRQQAIASKPDSNIVVIAIDDYSLTKLNSVVGRWVWPRSIHAELVEQLEQANVNTIIFDMLFAENDIYRPDDDAYFNEVIGEYSNLFFPLLVLNGDIHHGLMLKAFEDKLPLKITDAADTNGKALLLLPSAIDVHRANLGSINYVGDSDGVGRRYHVYQSLSGWHLASLATTVASYLNAPIPEKATILLKWQGNAQQPYKTYSYADVYQAIIENNQRYLTLFSGKNVLVAATAAGLYDARVTPTSHNLPGVYMLATAIDNLTNENYLLELPDSISIGLVALTLCGIALCYQYSERYSIKLMLSLIVVVLMAVVLWLTARLQLADNRVLYIGSALAYLALSYVAFAFIFGYREYLNRRQAVSMFGRFLDANVITSLLREKQLDVKKLSQKQSMTVLFSDIRNFTQLSESRSADEVVNLLNHYFNQQVHVIFHHQGTLDKFIGDCIMAFWGAPISVDNHAVNAINAAFEMEENLETFRSELPTALQSFDIGIGIHSGEAIVGFIGTDQRLDYTVIGDTVNLASRVEGLTKGCSRILVSEQTMELAQGYFEFEYQGEFSVKGRHGRVKLYQPKRGN